MRGCVVLGVHVHKTIYVARTTCVAHPDKQRSNVHITFLRPCRFLYNSENLYIYLRMLGPTDTHTRTQYG